MKMPTFRNFEGEPIEGMARVPIRTTATHLERIIVTPENSYIVDYENFRHMNHLFYRSPEGLKYGLLPSWLEENAMHKLIENDIPVRSLKEPPDQNDITWYDKTFLNGTFIVPTEFDDSIKIDTKHVRASERNLGDLAENLGVVGVSVVALGAMSGAAIVLRNIFGKSK